MIHSKYALVALTAVMDENLPFCIMYFDTLTVLAFSVWTDVFFGFLLFFGLVFKFVLFF
jgi:hypothetical protein